jgi:hypothetical protein
MSAEVAYSDPQNTGTPFRALAQYIGVFGNPQNEVKESMAMTAPVAMETGTTPIAMTAPVVIEPGTSIAMTAPVVMEKENESGGSKKMKFFLPEQYDELSKIPIPTNPAVKIAEVPPAVGAVHKFSGSFDDITNKGKAMALSAQLKEDGLDGLSDDHVAAHYQFWG